MNNSRILKASVLITSFSVVFVVLTIFGAMQKFEIIRQFCVCISNFLAYSWIVFGFSILFGVIQLIQFSLCIENCKLTKYWFLFQSISFIISLILLIFYGSYLLDVI